MVIYGHVLDMKVTGFIARVWGYERKTSIKSASQVFSLSNWQQGIAIYRYREHWRNSKSGMEIRVSILSIIV